MHEARPKPIMIIEEKPCGLTSGENVATVQAVFGNRFLEPVAATPRCLQWCFLSPRILVRQPDSAALNPRRTVPVTRGQRDFSDALPRGYLPSTNGDAARSRIPSGPWCRL